MSTEAAHLDGPVADRDGWITDRCSLDRAVRAVGSRSAMLLMREAFYGTRRFDDFAHRAGISEAVAASRLRELVAVGVLERRPYQEPGTRTRHEYALTKRGRDLFPVALALIQWGDRYLADPAGPPLLFTHHNCSTPLRAGVTCEAGHEVPLGEVGVAFAPNKLNGSDLSSASTLSEGGETANDD
ncbi:helix-turn-helix domain-containing protein [Streptomyces sp. AM2-3-1]|uniref:winged helix-turn-helix transcriptional regulator n=1 Tax=Streptomyces sp. AM2-3-1 TaxID=3075824 RepID=UPI0028C4975A|nr:helix-turn-helix domain-containing protein [Streptomyces sp. AM2-3-1]WNO62360.1 helix-turn-helix domain-containing protein [Streptomyces sp. AM2-3-1]WNO69586.1 helix-turn-helix domain-containing protein [Streptomyces sp. AM2-3-1]